MQQAMDEEKSQLNEELLTARDLVDATQKELMLMRAVSEEREGALRMELEQRTGAARLELDQQKALAAQTIEELSSALEAASAQLVEAHQERRAGGTPAFPSKQAKPPYGTIPCHDVAMLVLPEAAESEIDAAKEKARLSIKQIKSEADRRVSRVEADATRRIAAAERKATEAVSSAQDELIELEAAAKKKEEMLRTKLKRIGQELRHAQKMTQAARAERAEAEQDQARASRRDAAAAEKWAKQLARQESEWQRRLDAELDEVRRSRAASEREQHAATKAARQEAEALSNTTSALERLLAELRSVDGQTDKSADGSRVVNTSSISQHLKIKAVEELEVARRLLSKHRGDDERELRRARTWFAKQVEDLEDEAALVGKSFIDDSSSKQGRQRPRISAEELDDRMVDRVLEVFENKGALSQTQVAALRKLSGTKKIVKGANILQSWSFMDRLSTRAANTASDAARQLRREQVRPKSPVRRVSEAEAKKKFDQIRQAQEEFAERMEQERVKRQEVTALEATFVPMQTPAPPLAKLPGATQTYLRPPSPEAGRLAIETLRTASTPSLPSAKRANHQEPEPQPESLHPVGSVEASTGAERSQSPLRLLRTTMHNESDVDLAQIDPNSFVDRFLPAPVGDSEIQMAVNPDTAARIRRVAGWIALQEFEQHERSKKQHNGGATGRVEDVDFEAILRQRVASDTDQDWRFLQGTDVTGSVLFRQELQREREALFGAEDVAAD
jgi:hypothetical protein